LALTILKDCSGMDAAVEWVSMFDLTMPVHCDADELIWNTFNPDITFPAKPQAIVVDRDMTVLANEWEIDATDQAEAAVLDALE